MTSPEQSGTAAEQHRLLTAPTLATLVAGKVDELVELGSDDAPEWVMHCAVPPGWRPARLDNSPQRPARITVYSENPGHGWDGCETISVYRFTGTLPTDLIRTNADRTLRGLDAQTITTTTLTAPSALALTAVRSSGYFTVGTRRIWAQYSTYATTPTPPEGQGLLIEHALSISAGHQTNLATEISQLSNTIHHAFQAATIADASRTDN